MLKSSLLKYYRINVQKLAGVTSYKTKKLFLKSWLLKLHLLLIDYNIIKNDSSKYSPFIFAVNNTLLSSFMNKISSGPPPAEWLEALSEKINPHCRFCLKRHCQPSHEQFCSIIKLYGTMHILTGDNKNVSVRVEKDGSIFMQEEYNCEFFYVKKGPTYTIDQHQHHPSRILNIL